MEYLPKLRLFELYQEETGEEISILVESDPRDFVCNTLEAAGYDSTQYTEWNKLETRTQKLIVTTHRPHLLSNYNLSIRDLDWLRDRIRSNVSSSNTNSHTPNKIYISRQEANKGRKVINQSQLNIILRKHGFETYKLETLSFREQLNIIYNADIIMGPHGAGLSNMIFADNPIIIELFPGSVIRPHIYFCLICSILSIYMITNSEADNLIVDLDDLDKLLTNVSDKKSQSSV
jgi:capsular polysaccharide biosynthesis protein